MLLKKHIVACNGDVTFNPNNLINDDRELFFRGHLYSYWENEKQKVKNLNISRKDYERKLEQFKMLLLSTGANKKRLVVHELIKSKIEQLLKSSYKQNSFSLSMSGEGEQCSEEFLGKLTDINTKSFGETDRDILGKLTRDENIQKRETDTLLYSVSNGQPNRICKVTGWDISMQKDSSLFLCTTGIKYYRDHNPKNWAELKRRLSQRWIHENEDIQIREIAHSIRNQFNNSNRDILKRYRLPSLFDQSELIRKDKLRMFSLKSKSIANNNKLQCHAL